MSQTNFVSAPTDHPTWVRDERSTLWDPEIETLNAATRDGSEETIASGSISAQSTATYRNIAGAINNWKEIFCKDGLFAIRTAHTYSAEDSQWWLTPFLDQYGRDVHNEAGRSCEFREIRKAAQPYFFQVQEGWEV